MLKFLKSIFAKEPERGSEKAKFEELGKWIDRKLSKVKDELKEEIKQLKLKVDEENKKVEENIQTLKDAGLKNDKIPERAKHFMEGNREAYIKSVSNFTLSMNIPSEPKDFKGFYEDFNKKMEMFSKSTSRAYAILQEFFANESRDIALNIKSMDNAVNGVKESFEKKRYKEAVELKNDVLEFFGKLEIKEKLCRELEKKKSDRDELEKEKKEIETQKKTLIEGKEYTALQKLKKEKKESAERIKKKELELINAFSTLQSSLKKFSKITIEHENLVIEYISNPVKALIMDEGLKILDILSKISKEVEDGTIELKDAKRTKVIAAVAKIDKAFLEEYTREYSKIEKEIEALDNEIAMSNIGEIISKCKRKSERFDSELERLNGEIEKLEEDIGRIDKEKAKEEFEKSVREVFGVELEIGV